LDITGNYFGVGITVMKNHFIAIILTIFAVATLVRIVGMGIVPPHYSNDEISIAYDAYSVLHTGRDEHNQLLPLSFQSHSTYKAPLTAYLLLPTTALWGPSDWAAKLPSAILGSLTVMTFMILVWQIFRSRSLTIFSGLVMTMTPGHIYASHMILESNIALFFVVLGLTMFFRYVEKKKLINLVWAAVFLALSIYGYHTEWIFTPLIIAGMGIIYRRNLGFKAIAAGGLIFGLVLWPLIWDTFGRSGASTRANTEMIINEPTLQDTLHNPKLTAISKTQSVANAVLSNYANYFNLGYLFAYGLDIPPKPLTTQSGLFLAVFLPFFLIGLLEMFKLQGERKWFLMMLLFVAPVVPALTKGGANFVRALVMVVPMVMVIGLGLNSAWKNIKKTKLKIILVVIPMAISFGYFCLLYYFHYPAHAGENFAYGYRQAAMYINAHPNRYTKIVVDPKFGRDYEFVGVPHLYLAYFTRYDPAKFLKLRKDLPTGLYFEPFEIREINWGGEKGMKKTLYITPESNLPKKGRADLTPVWKIAYPNGETAFELFEGEGPI
jgi:4-amino-4-deoxy-L-arabinose transferase-like glycosyltransferase